MSVYKRGNVYWYEFWFRGQRIRQSSGLANKVAAQQAEAIRKAGLAEARAGIAGPKPAVNFGDFEKRISALGREAISVSSKSPC